MRVGYYVRALAYLSASAILLGSLAFLTSQAQTSPPVADNLTVTTPEDTVAAITLTAHDADGKPLTYSIVTQPSHGFVNLSGPRAVYTPNADYNGPDSFSFKANNGALDSNIAIVSVTITRVYHPPVASYTANPESGAPPLTINFDASASSAKDAPITSYTWDFGDGTTGSGATVTHNYSEEGTYTVKLTVTDKNGATASTSSLAIPVGTTARFAVIGDYGSNSSSENRVANFVKGWTPDFVATVGDNNYPHGATSTIDQNIGKYYQSFIGNYKGSYGPGSSTNRFWPALGNHDWDVGDKPYLDYFTLPNNERYYNVVLGGGLVQLFVIDSDSHEPDGNSSTSKQATWLKNALAASTACFKLVDFHHPPYTTWSGGSTSTMRWPFESWGADIVLAGHAHVYERLDASGFPYIVNGLGGENIASFGSKLPPGVKSVVRYNSDFGAMLVTANTSGITYQFYSAGGKLIDTYTQSKDCTGIGGGTPSASLSPTSLTFPSQTVGTTSAAQAVTLSNSGSAALSITSIAITGTNSGDFGQTNNCGSSVAAGSSCAINVTFTPAATGTRSATLTVTDNASNSPQTASLTGSGVSSGGTPTATLSRTSLTFGNQTVGTSSPAQSVTLSNSGSAALSISSFAITGDFSQTNNCGSSVGAGSSCTISVTFTPTAAGTRSGTLTITDNASNSPQTVSLTGSGVTATGSGPAFVQVQNNIDVSGAAFTSFSVNITTNPGDLLVAFVRESSSGTDNFTVSDSAGQLWTLTPSGYRNISSTGPRSGMFYVANSAAVTSVTVNYSTAGGVTKPGIMVMEISGAAALDSSVNNASGASVTISSSGNLTTTNANDILIFATDTGGNQTGWAAGPNYAIPSNNLAAGASGSNVRQAMQYAVVSSAQANTTTSMTYLNAAWNANTFAAFK